MSSNCYLGVHLQQFRAVLCLREQSSLAWPPATVGNGRHDAHLFLPPLTELNLASFEPRLLNCREMWRTLSEDFKAFLGPIVEESSTTHIGLAADSVVASAHVFAAEFFDKVVTISPARAGLLTYLVERNRAPSNRDVIVVVADDLSIGVHGFRVAARAEAPPRVHEVLEPTRISGTGTAFWIMEVIAAARARFVERRVEGADSETMWHAADELGRRLRDAELEELVPWDGPLPSGISYSVSRLDCDRWASVQRLKSELYAAIADARRCLDGRPDVIVVGSGADWPFVADILMDDRLPVDDRLRPRMLRSSRLAIAQGATLWPSMRAMEQRLFDDMIDLEPDKARLTVISEEWSSDRVDARRASSINASIQRAQEI